MVGFRLFQHWQLILTPGKWAKAGGQVTSQSELEADVVFLGSSCQDWLAMGVEQLEDKENCCGYNYLMNTS